MTDIKEFTYGKGLKLKKWLRGLELKLDKQKRSGYSVSATILRCSETYQFQSMNSCLKWLKDMFNINVDHKTLSRHCITREPYKGIDFQFINKTTQN